MQFYSVMLNRLKQQTNKGSGVCNVTWCDITLLNQRQRYV